MSKTKQRKAQAFHQGKRDALAGKPPRWERHPYLGYYETAYYMFAKIPDVDRSPFRYFKMIFKWRNNNAT